MSEEATVFVPWDNKELGLVVRRRSATSSRPGGRETWRVTVKTPDGQAGREGRGRAPGLHVRPQPRHLRAAPAAAARRPLPRTGPARRRWDAVLGDGRDTLSLRGRLAPHPRLPHASAPDELLSLGGYGIGGPGRRVSPAGSSAAWLGGVVDAEEPCRPRPQRHAMEKARPLRARSRQAEKARRSRRRSSRRGEQPAELRTNFAETAFWQPHLLTGADGTATIEFTVPDSRHGLARLRPRRHPRPAPAARSRRRRSRSRTSWSGPTCRASSARATRPSSRSWSTTPARRRLSGEVTLEITDPATGENLAPAFGLPAVGAGPGLHGRGRRRRDGRLPAGRAGPRGHGRVQGHGQVGGALRRRAAAAAGPAGPDAPRPVALRRRSRKGRRASCGSTTWPRPTTRRGIDEQLVVTVDAQLFYGAARRPALPRQLPLRVHRADAQPVPRDGHPDRPLRRSTRRSGAWPRS
ncbi:MAG: hypothetical protein M0C28_41770 [Candidatus Moduliflexus flocculans]|nr:hypothetical protein [Candidatus Moduliflexus flocculans]